MAELAHYVTDAVTASAFAFLTSRGDTQAERAHYALREVRQNLYGTVRILEAAGRQDAADRLNFLREQLRAVDAELFDAITRADDFRAEADKAGR